MFLIEPLFDLLSSDYFYQDDLPDRRSYDADYH